jgi:glycosyltransferase involved in cell wall biosynthesis
MNILVIVSHPFQFDGPFYQYAAKDEQNELKVIFTDQKRISNIYDPELKSSIDWGIDLFSGYSWSVLPVKKWRQYLRIKMESNHYDLIIVNGYNSSKLIYAGCLAKRLKIPVVLRLDTVPFNNKSIFKRLYKLSLFSILKKVYSYYFAIGSLTKQYLLSLGIKEENISFFSYVVDNNYFKTKSNLSIDKIESVKAKFNIPKDYKIILSVAKFNTREAPWDLLKSFSKLDDRQKICLMLVGDGEKRKELEEFAKKYPVKNIIFTGYIPYPDLPLYYGISNLFVHTSCNGPWGVSVQEALASGLPVITSNMVGSSVDLIEIGKNGFVYPAGDIEKLSEYIQFVLDNMSKDKVRTVNEHILQKWNYQSTWNNLISVSKKLNLDKNF